MGPPAAQHPNASPQREYCIVEELPYGKQAQLNQLRQLNWIEQLFNIVLMGASGTGKTFIAIYRINISPMMNLLSNITGHSKNNIYDLPNKYFLVPTLA
ncbi:MAG: ATP-binding protein [Cyclobacteriaceae bacterium]|nr:ATP-binding protein [Cyclobacteriaceae bacterium]MCK5703133.1 ATP-binding protein [Cyclobacteriaceae bacterium]